MLKPLTTIALAAALTGCGTGSRLASPAASLVRSGVQDTAVAEQAIRTTIERHAPDHFVSLQVLKVSAPQGSVFAFTAEEHVSGLSGAVKYHLQGNYDASLKAVQVVRRDAF